MNKAQIIAALPKLSATELAEVATAVKMVGKLGQANPETEPSSDWLLGGIATYLIQRGLIAQQSPVWGLRKRDAHKAYLAKVTPVRAFLERLERDQVVTLSRHRAQLAIVCAEALAEWLERRTIFSVSAMLSQIDKLPEALDEAFPGYVQSGMIGFVLRVRE